MRITVDGINTDLINKYQQFRANIAFVGADVGIKCIMKKKAVVVKMKRHNAAEKQPVKIPEKNDIAAMARYFEHTNDPGKAAKLYERLIRSHRFNEHNYNRLMMIYRRKKDFKNELRVINEGIKAFQEFYLPFATGRNRAVINLSKKLNVLIGLTDRKGRSIADTEPIGKWKRRKDVVLRKLKG